MSELVSAYPTSGGIYWWASKMGGPAAGFFTGWLNLIGLLAVTASVAYGAATFFDLTLSTLSSGYADSYSLTRVFITFVVILVLAATGQHLQRPPAGDRQQHLGVVARRRRRDRDPGPDRRARHPPERRLRVHRADQQLRLQQRVSTGSWCCRSASCSRSTRSPASTPPPTCRRRPRGRPNGAAKGIWRSIFYSAVGGYVLLLAFVFAVQDPAKVTAGGGARRRDLRPGAAPGLALPRAADLHGRPAVLHDGLPDQRLADDVRVQPRRRDPGLALARPRSTATTRIPANAVHVRGGRRRASSRCRPWSGSTSTARRCRSRSTRSSRSR